MKKIIERFKVWLLGKLAPALPEAAPDITDDEIIERAQQLLANPVYQLIVRKCINDISNDWRRTRPDDAGARDFLYNQQMAIKRFDITLRAMIGRLQYDHSLRGQAQKRNKKPNGGKDNG